MCFYSLYSPLSLLHVNIWCTLYLFTILALTFLYPTLLENTILIAVMSFSKFLHCHSERPFIFIPASGASTCAVMNFAHTYNNQTSDGGDLELKHVCVSITRKKMGRTWQSSNTQTTNRKSRPTKSLRTPGY